MAPEFVHPVDMRTGKWTVTERKNVASKVTALAAAGVQRITGPLVAGAVPARSLAAVNSFLRHHYGGQHGLPHPKRDHKRKRVVGTGEEGAAVDTAALVEKLMQHHALHPVGMDGPMLAKLQSAYPVQQHPPMQQEQGHKQVRI
jgi:hypothetical protein